MAALAKPPERISRKQSLIYIDRKYFNAGFRHEFIDFAVPSSPALFCATIDTSTRLAAEIHKRGASHQLHERAFLRFIAQNRAQRGGIDDHQLGNPCLS